MEFTNVNKKAFLKQHIKQKNRTHILLVPTQRRLTWLLKLVFQDSKMEKETKIKPLIELQS